MLKRGDKIKIRFRRAFDNQMFHFIVGEVVDFNNEWIKILGRNYYSTQPQLPPKVTEHKQLSMIPREVIRNIDILPRNLNLDKIKYTYKDGAMRITTPEQESLYKEF